MNGDSMWAIREDGTWRFVDSEIPLDADETLYEDIPQWAVDAQVEAATHREQVSVEAEWQQAEIDVIANQLMALEEAEVTGENTGALPGTRVKWLQYRTKVRNWKDGAEYFPDLEHRPSRPD